MKFLAWGKDIRWVSDAFNEKTSRRRANWAVGRFEQTKYLTNSYKKRKGKKAGREFSDQEHLKASIEPNRLSRMTVRDRYYQFQLQAFGSDKKILKKIRLLREQSE